MRCTAPWLAAPGSVHREVWLRSGFLQEACLMKCGRVRGCFRKHASAARQPKLARRETEPCAAIVGRTPAGASWLLLAKQLALADHSLQGQSLELKVGEQQATAE